MRKKIFINLILILMMILLIPSNSSYALSQDQQYSIASYAERFTSSNYNIFYDDQANRANNYYASLYFTDATYVQYVYDQVLGEDFGNSLEGTTDQIITKIQNGSNKYFEVAKGSKQLGDIVAKDDGKNKKLGIYIGNNQVVFAQNVEERTEQISVQSASGFNNVFRVKSSVKLLNDPNNLILNVRLL